LHRAKIVFANFRLAKRVRALPKHQSAAGAEARSVRLLTLVVASFSLISQCTRRAHAAFYPVEKIELSLQSIMGATENRGANILMLFRFIVTPGTVDGWADN
jgi:hypothetical protein